MLSWIRVPCVRTVRGSRSQATQRRTCSTRTAVNARSDIDAQRTATTERRVRIYTRTGDAGSSSLFTGQRRRKNDPIFDVLGHSDELNAHVGLCIEYLQREASGARAADVAALIHHLSEIQSRLLDIGSFVATPQASASEEQRTRTQFDATASVAALEAWIDRLDASLPPLRQFILPGGTLAAAELHVTRAVTRRLERAFVDAFLPDAASPTPLPPDAANVLRYINRLSDFFFVAARWAAFPLPDRVYKKA